MANHLANRAKAGPSTEVVLVGDSITDAWGLTLPPALCDAVKLEQRTNALKTNNHMGYVKGVLMQIGLIWVWIGTYAFGSSVRINAMAWLLRAAMDFPRRSFMRSMSGPDPMSCVSMGIMGDRTRHLLWRVMSGELDLAWANVDKLSPQSFKPLKVVVMLIGVNNLGYKEYSPEETARHIANCAAVIAMRYEGVQVLIHQLLPADNTITSTRANRASVAKVNKTLVEQLSRLCKESELIESNVHLVDDVAPLFANKDGSCNLTLLPDELHLNEAGYDIWATALAPHIAAAKGRWEALNS